MMYNGENFIYNFFEENKLFRFNIVEIMKLGIDFDILKLVGLDKI